MYFQTACARVEVEQKWGQVLVFTRTKHGANRLAGQLGKDGIFSMAIHGNKSQGARTRALASFKEGKVRVLVATDIAARGLDIEQLPLVVNFEMPMVAEDYVHRIGRTGRAGLEGHAISLVSPEEKKLLADIEKLLKRRRSLRWRRRSSRSPDPQPQQRTAQPFRPAAASPLIRAAVEKILHESPSGGDS